MYGKVSALANVVTAAVVMIMPVGIVLGALFGPVTLREWLYVVMFPISVGALVASRFSARQILYGFGLFLTGLAVFSVIYFNYSDPEVTRTGGLLDALRGIALIAMGAIIGFALGPKPRGRESTSVTTS